MTKREKKIVSRIILLLLVLIVMSCLGIPGVDLFFWIPFGWIEFALKVFPQVQIHWAMVATAGAYAATLVVGSHLFLGWVYREITRGQRWQWRWTFSGLAIFVLMFLSGMSVIGIVHQTAWLITSPVPIYKYDTGMRETANRVKCASNLRQIGTAIAQYLQHNGDKYPDDFRELFLHENIRAAEFVCPSSNDEMAVGNDQNEIANTLLIDSHCSYVYLAKGMSAPLNADRPIACEPLTNHQNQGMETLFADGHVEFIDKQTAEKILPKPAPPPPPATTN